MKLTYILSITLLAICSASQGKADNQRESPLVQLKDGLVKGIIETSLNGNEFYSFVGIPYAKPPLGTLRFKDPVAVEPWQGTVGTEQPDNCLQYGMFDVVLPDKKGLEPMGKEDCLYLNLFTPKLGSSSKLPVMVFIHGGAFVSGGAESYLPHVLMTKDIVLVVIQYRLGIFGFLSTGDSEAPGNMGLKDQQMALKWIQKNVLQLGGDPDRVTIFGESAGGSSAHMQMLAPSSKGLFHRIIAQSGTALCPWSTSIKHKKFAQSIGIKYGCPLSDNGSNEYLNCMQKVDAMSLLNSASDTVSWGFGPLYVLPRVDGDFFPDEFEVLLEEGRYNKVDVISGIAKHEGGFLMSIAHLVPSMIEDLKTNFKEAGPLSLQEFGEPLAEDLAKKIYNHYLHKDLTQLSPSDTEQLVKLFSDQFFGLCHDRAAIHHVKDDQISVFLYELNHPGQRCFADSPPITNKNNWTSHVDDLFYMFSGGRYFYPIERKDDLKLREIILSLWTNFAATGNPTPLGSPFTWEKATPSNFQHLSLNPNPKMEGDNFSEIRNFWYSVKGKANNRGQGAPKHPAEKNKIEL